jgi:hypothetical protein
MSSRLGPFLLDLGATRVREESLAEHGSNWILMQDPEGNEFCVCDAALS